MKDKGKAVLVNLDCKHSASLDGVIPTLVFLCSPLQPLP